MERVLEDGSYLSWIAPDGKSKKKGCTTIPVRVIEYTIETGKEQQTYRLITSLMDIDLFPASLLAAEYHQRWEVENTIDELKTHLTDGYGMESFRIINSYLACISGCDSGSEVIC